MVCSNYYFSIRLALFFLDLIRNPSALNLDELSEINKLDSMNDMFMNPEVTSETREYITGLWTCYTVVPTR
jgi:hypothetical protein